MTFRQLKDYIGKKMRMQHIYQPVMLMTLLQRKGTATRRQIAKEILARDGSQIEYYEQVVQNMVGDVLTRRRGITERDGHTYRLKGYAGLTEVQVAELMQLCRDRLDAYMAKWGERAFQHRKKSAGYVSGTLRYEVLKRAKFHCELCGISAKDKALEVDHIVPRNKGGEDDISNLQALCYSCNAMKRDRDDTDFREVRESYKVREADCPFCTMEKKRVIAENPLAYAVRDGYPVTELHMLVLPRRHVADYFDLGRPEENACRFLLEEMKADIQKRDKSVEGFNIGWNCGEAAGQTVFHAHVHLIPRRKGDVENPRGGVRHIIPGKGRY
jgi:diadenosine tetraphosphate (Ap4A) HIT family hydrolase/5-methylcytosine-specific restriction endonuclease McrA